MKDNNLKSNVITIIAVEILYCIAILIVMFLTLNSSMVKAEEIRKIELIAHRGASYYFPENTMASIKGALEFDADWIEVDIHQTKDGKLVLSHDSNLSRTSGYDINIFEADYKDIKNIDVGSFLDTKFSEERIPLLEDVIKFAKKNNTNINIELKPTSNEVDFEKQVVELVEKYEFVDNCIISSGSYIQLENVKKLNDQIKTGYIVIYPLSDITDLTYADMLVVEYNAVNYDFVEKAHKNGKVVNAWVLNDEQTITEVINMGVDYVTSDHVELAREIIDSANKIQKNKREK